MKLFLRSVIAVLFLAALTLPAFAQSPKLAVKIGATSGGRCFLITLKNLQTAPVTATAAYLVVFDQTNCKRTCESKIAVNRLVKPCETYSFRICCSGTLPPKYIAYVRVPYSGGYNESFFSN